VTGAVSISFLTAVIISNLPEGMGAADDLSAAGWSKKRIVRIWLAVIVVSAGAAGIGYLFNSLFAVESGLAKAFAAGALLTMLADSMMPEAFEHGGKLVGLLTVFGFALSFALGQLS
jgi:ZIP family zinc transporter